VRRRDTNSPGANSAGHDNGRRLQQGMISDTYPSGKTKTKVYYKDQHHQEQALRNVNMSNGCYPLGSTPAPSIGLADADLCQYSSNLPTGFGMEGYTQRPLNFSMNAYQLRYLLGCRFCLSLIDSVSGAPAEPATASNFAPLSPLPFNPLEQPIRSLMAGSRQRSRPPEISMNQGHSPSFEGSTRNRSDSTPVPWRLRQEQSTPQLATGYSGASGTASAFPQSGPMQGHTGKNTGQMVFQHAGIGNEQSLQLLPTLFHQSEDVRGHAVQQAQKLPEQQPGGTVMCPPDMDLQRRNFQSRSDAQGFLQRVNGVLFRETMAYRRHMVTGCRMSSAYTTLWLTSSMY
jgi:hypothetical protein